jgi:predicted small secreted protein
MLKIKKWSLIFLVVLLSGLVLSACAGGKDIPAQTVELYHQALVDKDEEKLINYSCADWESQAIQDLDSFVAVETTLVDFSCQTVSEEGDTARVTCNGAISATYNGEAQEFPLSGRTFLVVQENNEWRLCGSE